MGMCIHALACMACVCQERTHNHYALLLHALRNRFRGSITTPALSEQEMRKIHEDCPEHVILVEQKSMDVMCVPPGWIHCVVNLQLCMKFAYDRVMVYDSMKAPVIHRMFNVPYFRQASAPDYTSTVINGALELSTIVKMLREETDSE